MANLNVAVVGANGFIGKHLVRCLQTRPEIQLSLFGRSAQSEFQNYKQIDLNNAAFVSEHFNTIDYIFYLASETIPATSWEDPKMEIEQNLIPFLNFLQSVSQLNVKKIGFLSSAGTIYGQSNNLVKEEDNKQPFSPYGIVKLSMENFLNYYFHKTKLAFDIFRISNVYGEGQDTSKGLGLINVMIEKILTDKKITVFGDGENLRNYIYVKDVVELLVRSLSLNSTKTNIINIASNDTLSINQIVNVLKKIIAEDFETEYKDQRGSDNRKAAIDNTKLKELIPDFSFTSIDEGVKQTYNFIKKNYKSINNN